MRIARLRRMEVFKAVREAAKYAHSFPLDDSQEYWWRVDYT